TARMTNRSPGLAAYQRVAEAIKADIRSGALQVGQQLPGHRTLAEQHGVALGTAQKALQLLEDQGWVVAQPAVGVFVNEPLGQDDGEEVTVETINQQLSDLQAAVENLARRVERLEGDAPSRSLPRES